MFLDFFIGFLLGILSGVSRPMKKTEDKSIQVDEVWSAMVSSPIKISNLKGRLVPNFW
jgi:hypothetical protein